MMFVNQTRMSARQRHPEADEGKKRVWQPIHPPQALFRFGTGQQPIHPHVEELVRAKARYVICLERTIFQTTATYIVVSLEWSDVPPDWAFGQHRSCSTVCNRNGLSFQLAEPSRIAPSRKRWRRALKPDGISKMRSSPVMTSIFRVLS